MKESSTSDHIRDLPLNLFIGADGSLYARVLAAATTSHIDLNGVQGLVNQMGFGHYHVSNAGFSDLLSALTGSSAADVLLATKPLYVALSLEYNSQTRQLFAVLSETSIESKITADSIQKEIETQNLQDLDIRQNSILDLVKKAAHNELGTFLIGEKPSYTQILFTQDQDSDTLFAHLTSSEKEFCLTPDHLQEMLISQGYEHYYLEPNALEGILKKASINERGRFAIGEKRDARIEISFDEELMTAYITVLAAQGGKDLDQQIIESGLANSDIDSSCCDTKILEKILKDQHAKKIAFAFGVEPVDGTDTRFKPLVEEIEHITPEETRSGKIDLREIINFTQVNVGDKLMQRIPSVAGINGRNVKGQVIPAVDGESIPFNTDLYGAQTSLEDENILVATERGHPVILNDGVRVDKTLIVNNVDMSSGNINYDGSLMVKGEVFPGMKIKVTGDICVQGVVTKASLHAKNNIKIMCGIIGSDPSKDGEESPPATIKAGGNITAQYATQSKLTAGNNVEAKEYLSHCEVEAKNKILVGQQGGKGKIFGGYCFAQAGIEANSLGTDGSVKTFVSAGTPHHQQKQYEKLQATLKNRKEQAKQLRGMLHKYALMIKTNPEDQEKLEKIHSIKGVLHNLTDETKKMEATLAKINRFFKEGKRASVIIRKTTFPNVTISINGAEFNIRQNSKGGTFTKVGGEIRWHN